MKPLYIIGAGGAAKEIYILIKNINRRRSTYDFKGFIDITPNGVLQIGNKKFTVYKESIFLKECKENVALVFGLGDVNRLKKIVKTYQGNINFEFPNIIHPDVELDDSISLGMGNIITTRCVLTVDISLHSFNYINRGVHIGHDCTIGSFNVINPCAVISGGVCVDDENLIGTNATILQYLNIGSRNIIGAGAMVTKNVSNENCMLGIPAKNKK